MDNTQIKSYAVRVVAVAMASFHLYTAAFGLFDAVLQRSIHLGFALILLMLIYPHPRFGDGRVGLAARWGLMLLIAASVLLPIGYLIVNLEYLTDGRIQFVSDLSPLELVFGCSLLAGLLELCRRVTGPVLPVICMVFLVYPFLPGMPGVLKHGGYTLSETIEFQYMTLSGVFGVPLAASANFIVLFIIFGAFLERSGLGGFIMDFAIGLVGRYRGGPAKVAVISSAITGTISGSAMANVLTTGTLTIPLMRRTGYPAFMAGAIEAAASTGGALMPPVMGTVAFVMSEFSGIPYGTIVLYAAIPAALYFLGVFCTVHWAAVRYDAAGLPEDELPDWRAHLRERGHLLIPLVVLITLLVKDFSPQYAVTYSILTVLGVSWFRRSTRMGPKKIVEALENGAKGAVLVAIATACAGMMVGIFEMTTVGLKLAQQGAGFAETLFGGMLLTMAVSLILGMGVPPTVSYITQVAVTIPMLLGMLTSSGIDPYTAKVVTHFFVMYFATLAVLTPPDALASIAAAGVAQSPVIKTALHATRIAFVAFIVPFMFVYRPALLTLDSGWAILLAVLYAVMGIVVLSAALEGYAFRKLTLVERLLGFAAGFALVVPDPVFDTVGLALFALLGAMQFWAWRQKKKSA
ncbi:MAG: TRAP transporter fused permease subunit [Proteobacteria bacterium]|nr:TRAP transporter fused permease subunit [Pseudomonadota bacterium]